MSKRWDDFKKYLFEVLAIITAITLSFLFDEWREKRKDRRNSIELLSSIADNLKSDTSSLRMTLELQNQMLAGQAHILNHPDSLKPDSLTLGLLAFQTYPAFRKNDVAYLTMVQTGQSRVIENKKLLNQINNLYQVQYKYIDEWTEIERRTVLEKNIAYINTNIPYVKKYRYFSLLNKNRQFTAILKKDEFRNLLSTDHNFKTVMNLLYTKTQKSVDSLLRTVDTEIKRLRD